MAVNEGKIIRSTILYLQEVFSGLVTGRIAREDFDLLQVADDGVWAAEGRTEPWLRGRPSGAVVERVHLQDVRVLNTSFENTDYILEWYA